MAASASSTDVEQAGVEEEVRRLVARELHDRVVQTLTGMLVEVENFKSDEVGWHDVVTQLDMIQTSTREVLSSLRQLLHDLRGEEPLRAGFGEAVSALVGRFQSKTGIVVSLDVTAGWPATLNSAASLNVYRMLEEALNNVRMHSGARKVEIRLDKLSESELTLVVSDDGRGVETDPGRPVGLGTIGMKERALFLGGKLLIDSEVGHGTVVRAVFPKNLLAAEPTPSSDTIKLARRNLG